MRRRRAGRLASLVLLLFAAARPAAAEGTSPLATVAGPVCRLDGWCWEYPLLPGTSFYGVGGTSSSDVWAIAAMGHSGESSILHWDGKAWSQSFSSKSALSGVWASAPDDAWAVGDGGSIVHWDGRRWSAAASATRSALKHVHGTARDDVWAVGFSGTLVHYDGIAWRAVDVPTRGTLASVWAATKRDAWIVSCCERDYRGVFRWDGDRFRTVTDAPRDGVAVGGRAPNDVWVVTDHGGVWRWNGATWTQAVAPTRPEFFRQAWGPAHDALWAVTEPGREVMKLNGTTWTRVAIPGEVGRVQRVWGSATSDVWLMGEHAFARWDGARWHVPVQRDRRQLWDVFAISPDEIWAVGADGIVLRRASSGWAIVPFPSAESLAAVFGSAGDDVWVGGHSVWRWNGKSWAVSLDALTSGIWGIGRDDVWAVGDGAFHWNGAEWTKVWKPDADLHESLAAVWGSGPRDVWAVGGFTPEHEAGGSVVLHWDGDRLSEDGKAFDAPLGAIWGTRREVYVGGPTTPLWRLRKGNWERAAAVEGVTRIWGRGADDIWMTTPGTDAQPTDHRVRRWDGSGWSIVGHFGTWELRAITGTPARVWIVGVDSAGYPMILSRQRVP